ncbi:MAG: 3'(2'),5'-bisphosphate nucleotidase CysQ [Sulfuritalea sp.]|nr:3'(2'),5'-bisphosphate nucleotidase CysQ [Sulfuritalea sp.]
MPSRQRRLAAARAGRDPDRIAGRDVTDRPELLDRIVAIAGAAGDEIMAVYARAAAGLAINRKADNSPLTEADERAHRLIATRLAALSPALPLLSEEDVASFPGPDRQGRYWLVDPLDGTKEFIKRNGEFTVNIALIEAGRPVLGVVHAPALGVSYLAAEGIGAFRQTRGAARQSIAAAKHRPGTVWRVVGSRSHGGDRLAAFLADLGEYELAPMGSSLKFCLVAEGQADLYPRLGPTSLWDTGAAQCVVEQAGGSVRTLEGRPLGYADTGQLLNPYFVAAGAVC